MTQSDSRKVQDWMEKGLLHLQCLNYVEALACFNQALKLNPSHSEAWSKCGSVLEKLGCYREAIAVNQTVQHLLMKPGLILDPPALTDNPAVIAANQALQSTAQYWLNRGATLYTLGHHTDAITSYDKAIELDPTNHSAWSNRCLALYYLGYYDEAVASYDKVIEIKPDDYYAWTGRAHALVGMDRYEAAIASYNKALEIQPDYAEAVTHRTIALDHIDSLKTKLSKEETVVDFEVHLNNSDRNGQSKLGSEIPVQVPSPEPEPEPLTVNESEPPVNEEIAAENYQDYFWRGNECYALGQYEAAIVNYGKTVELKPDYHKAWYNRGISLSKLGQYEAAVFSYDKALEIKPDKHQAWFHRGVALSELGQVEEAIASYDKALDIKPDYSEAWTKRGTLLVNLAPPDEVGSPEDITVPDLQRFAFKARNEWGAIPVPESVSTASLENSVLSAELSVAQTSNSQPLSELDPPTLIHEIDPPTFIHEIVEPEVESFETLNSEDEGEVEFAQPFPLYAEIAPEVRPFEMQNGHVTNLVEIEEPSVLYQVVESEVESEIDTISDFEEPEGLGELGDLDEMSISHDDIALSFAQNDPEEWDDFGDTLPESEDVAIAHDETLIPLSQAQQWMLWEYKGLRALCNQNPRAAYRLWEEGIQILKTDNPDQRYGCGQLYLRKGRTQYSQACKQPNPIPEWITARDTFLNALDYFTYNDFPEQHLETLQELLRVCHLLADTYAIEQILPQGSATLVSLLQNPNLTRSQKIALESKFAGFVQLQVDVIAQYSPSQALELAESTKNHRLSRFRKGCSPHQTDQLQQELQTLLTPGTAAIYWYLSPAALTTFVLKQNQPPVIVQSMLKSLDQVQHPELQDYPPATYQLRQFETWMQLWKQSYQQYCDLDSESAQYAPWRQNMAPLLYLQLRKILEINRICADYLKDIDHIILIPHRDLHLIPLHALFPGRFTLSYLPSLQLGLDLQHRPALSIQRLLSVEGPTSNPPAQLESSDLVFKQLQSAVIAHLYGKVRSLAIPSQEATHNKVVSALKMMSGCFHFAGQSHHDLAAVQKSALTLTHEEGLTLADILRLDLSRYELVCVTAGQTGIANDQSMMDEEYLSLTHGFLSAGVTHVVNTLWPVDEGVSSLLMIQFHQFLLQKVSPIHALRSAQDWLSTLTYEQLSEWYRNLAMQMNVANPSSADGSRLNALAQVAANEPEPQNIPYAHPFYWAGFTIAGKVPEAMTE